MHDKDLQASESVEGDSARPAPESACAGEVPVRRVRRVLLVEDDPIDAIVVRRSLRDADDAEYVIEHATSLARALEFLSRDAFHVVLLDLMLPDSAGLQTFRAVHERFPHVPVIVLSGLDDKQVALDATAAGAQDYVVKGNFTPDLLQRSIRHARVRHKILQQLERSAEEVRQRERLLVSVLESIDEAVIVVERDGRFALMNPAAKRILGGPAPVPPEVWSRHYGFFLPDGCTLCPAEELPLVRAMRGEATAGLELVLRNEHVRDGMALLASARPLKDGTGSLRGGVVVLRDITAQKRALEEHIQRVAIERDLELAGEVQQRLFPREMPQLPGMDVAARVVPARRACGDYFDFVQLEDGRLVCVIADVSGHDLGSALVMAQTQAYLRAAADRHGDLTEVLKEVNRHLWSPADPVRFVTKFLACVDPRTRQLDCASAGHPGFLVLADGTVRMLDATGTVLGLFENAEYTKHPPITLNSGDVLIVPTDGVYEAHASDGELFSTERLVSLLRECRHRPAAEIIDCVFQAALEFGGDPPRDDLSAIAIKAV